MKKHSIYRHILVAAMALAGMGAAQAQNSSLAYLSQRMPQCNSYNPAFFPERNNFYLLLPGANISFGSPLSYSNIFRTNAAGDTTIIDANHLLDTLSSDGRLRFNTDVDVIGLGLKIGRVHFTANAKVHTGFGLGLPTGLSSFLNDGNMNYRGEGNELYLLDGDLLNANIYAEGGVGLGVAFLDDALTVGARLKMFVGYLNASTYNTALRLYTAEDLSELRTTLNYDLRTAGCVALDSASLGRLRSGDLTGLNYLPENRGFGLDLGARFVWKKFDFSASLLDLGASIDWKENVRHIVPANGEGTFSFSGIDLNEMLSAGSFSDTMFTQMVDSLMAMVDPTTVEGGSYRTYLPAKLNLSAMFRVTPWFRVGAMYHGEFDIKSSQPLNSAAFQPRNYRGRASVVGQVSLADWIEVIANVAVVDDGANVSWFNPGVGVSLSLFKAIQVSAIMDSFSTIYLVDAKSFSVSVGLNLMVVNKRFKWNEKKK